MKKVFPRFDPADMLEFEPEAKVGLIATVNPQGLPHITLITALQAKTPTQLIWGQFSEGMSKRHVRTNPKTGFAIMTMDRSLWRGKARWTHTATHGEDHEMFNLKPMFRYNAYTGLHTIHYMDLVETGGREKLPLASIALSSILTALARPGARSNRQGRILKPWAQGLFNRLDSVKFISWLDPDGFPVIVPLIQCQAPDSTRLAFSPLAYREELEYLQEGMVVAVFGLTLQMEDVLVRGVFAGFGKFRGITLGCMDIDWVYNSMPPVHGQIYPELGMQPVVHFQGGDR
ncbi:MAG TPA: pyridoxamine 5'-phosphate oxidase family protein [Deltaproteobacteria bacterium]|nr:pyridoxamine 5'-phosphate oxidase family protein [Deltaproteobacteria bacterium]HQI79963.1 pyridoxamine 5'-phosphate oxidase family protein [Deltaproteobacteria bacterium]